MAGFLTSNNEHLIRSNLWSSMIKEVLLDELFATKYVDMLTDFPDGDTLNIPSIGLAEVHDYVEGDAIRYTAMDTGNFTFTVNKYKSSATYITEKMKQDSFYMSKLVASFVPKQHRAIMKQMEVDVLALGNSGQTASDPNTINTAAHRYVAAGTNGQVTPIDFARANFALDKANVPANGRVAIIDSSAAYQLQTLTNLVNLSNNKAWEGIVREGASTGIRYLFNVFGFDVYISQNLPSGITETVSAVTVTTNGVANYFFSSAPDVCPFVGLVRQAPKVDSDYNKDLQREEYVTTCRYGFKLYRPENMVVCLSDASQVTS